MYKYDIPKVLVIMATYNGGKYIQEQIQSILEQTDVEIQLNIYDDCSGDNTVDIVLEFSKLYPNKVNLIQNTKNKGYTYNFLDAIFDSSDNFDFYALSDQDDIWKSNKLINAIKCIQTEQPMLYSSALTLVDAGGGYVKDVNRIIEYKNSEKIDFFYNNYCTGCTAVFNLEFKKMVCYYYPKGIHYHDYYLFLIATFCGRFYYDENSYILYRQHFNNQIGANKKVQLKRRISKLFDKDYERINGPLCRELYIGYRQYIDTENISNIKMFGNTDNILNKMIILTHPEYCPNNQKLVYFLKILFNKF